MNRTLPNFRKYLAVRNSTGPKVHGDCFEGEYQSIESDWLHEFHVKRQPVLIDRSKLKIRTLNLDDKVLEAYLYSMSFVDN